MIESLRNYMNFFKLNKLTQYYNKKRPVTGVIYIATLICGCLCLSGDKPFVYFCFLLFFLLLMFLIELVYYLRKKTLILIKHNSFTTSACNQKLPPVLHKNLRRIKEFNIDQCRYTKNNSVKNLKKAYKVLHKRVNKLIKKYSDKNHNLALSARCHIPFMFYLGCNLSNLQLKLFEISRNGNHLIEISSNNCKFPSLKQENYIRPKNDILNIVISISTKINTEFISDTSSFVELFLDEPHFDAIVCNQQLDNYANVFFKLLNECQQDNINRINIYYAGPMSLAFKLGQMIKPTIHPEVYVYNFSNMDTPNYGWALKMSSNLDYNNLEDYRRN